MVTFTPPTTDVSPVIRELVLANMGHPIVVDQGMNLHLPAPELVPQVRFWYDWAASRMTICPGNCVPLDYVSSQFRLLRHTSLCVAGVIQPRTLKKLSAFSSTIRMELAPDTELPALCEIVLGASSLHFSGTLGNVTARLSSGSQIIFGPSASVNSLCAQFLDSHAGNLIKARYYTRCTDDSREGCRGTLSVERIGTPPRTPQLSIGGRTPAESWWERMRPVVRFTGQGNACTICQHNRAEWIFTVCKCPSLCSECVGPALRNGLIESRRCPLCRSQGRPAALLPALPAVHSAVDTIVATTPPITTTEGNNDARRAEAVPHPQAPTAR